MIVLAKRSYVFLHTPPHRAVGLVLIAQALGATNAGTMAKRRLRSPRGSQNDANAVEVKVEEYGGVVSRYSG